MIYGRFVRVCDSKASTSGRDSSAVNCIDLIELDNGDVQLPSRISYDEIRRDQAHLFSPYNDVLVVSVGFTVISKSLGKKQPRVSYHPGRFQHKPEAAPLNVWKVKPRFPLGSLPL